MAGRVVRASPAADSRRSSPRRRAGRLGLFALGTPSTGAARRRVPPAISNRSLLGCAGRVRRGFLARGLARLGAVRGFGDASDTPFAAHRSGAPLRCALLRAASAHGAPARAASPRPPLAPLSPSLRCLRGKGFVGIPASASAMEKRRPRRFIPCGLALAPRLPLPSYFVIRTSPPRVSAPIRTSSFVLRHCAMPARWHRAAAHGRRPFTFPLRFSSHPRYDISLLKRNFPEKCILSEEG